MVTSSQSSRYSSNCSSQSTSVSSSSTQSIVAREENDESLVASALLELATSSQGAATTSSSQPSQSDCKQSGSSSFHKTSSNQVTIPRKHAQQTSNVSLENKRIKIEPESNTNNVAHSTKTAVLLNGQGLKTNVLKAGNKVILANGLDLSQLMSGGQRPGLTLFDLKSAANSSGQPVTSSSGVTSGQTPSVVGPFIQLRPSSNSIFQPNQIYHLITTSPTSAANNLSNGSVSSNQPTSFLVANFQQAQAAATLASSSSSQINRSPLNDFGYASLSGGESSCSQLSQDDIPGHCGSQGSGSDIGGQKKRGRKRMYAETLEPSASNPIKEFRQRQRMREKAEDDKLDELEARYRQGHSNHEFPEPLESLYEHHGLNIKFNRVKTINKRGKAADEDERSNRKKECARRDSKNYRERAKAKRDLVLKKIDFLDKYFTEVQTLKFKYIFK